MFPPELFRDSASPSRQASRFGQHRKWDGPRQAAVGRKTQTDSLPQLIANERSIFRNEIDKMVTKKKKANPDFYAGYFAARIIVNHAATHATPKPPAPSAPTKT
jgi:hypothetical protein